MSQQERSGSEFQPEKRDKKHERMEDRLIRQLVREAARRAVLYEGLIYSYSHEIVIRKVFERGFRVNRDAMGKIIVGFELSKKNRERYQELNDFLDNVCGWIHGSSKAGGTILHNKTAFLPHSSGIVHLIYEPKFNVEVSKKPEVLYHVSPISKIENIMRVGLTPRSSDYYFSFKDRIYLSREIDLLYNFAKKKFQISGGVEKKFVIFAIKPNKQVRFFEDPNFREGVYTLENISRFSITPIEEVELDESGEVINKIKI